MLNEKLKRYWNEEYKVKGDKATLHVPLARLIGRETGSRGFTCFWRVASESLRLVFGQLIRWFLGESNHSNPLMNNGYFPSFLIVLGGVAVTMLHHHAFFQHEIYCN